MHCWRSTGHGGQKTPQALQNSCNLAFAHIALKLGGDRFYEYVKNFGILEKTGIDLAGESKGVFFDKALVTDTDKWGTASLTSGSFGQTFKLTPLQLVRAISAVVNGGVLMEPYIVAEAIDEKGNSILVQEPTEVRRVISQETSKLMCSLMESVVTEGTAKNAQVAGFSIGGKTGTSEKIDVFDANGQRVLDKIVSFVGVAPMDDPEYIVLVALDTPSRSTGIYISGHPMDDYRQLLKNTHVVPIGDLMDEESKFQDDQIVSVAGIVQGAKMKTTRNNSMMAYVTVEDDTASMEMLAFSSVLSQFGNYLKENEPVVITGRLSMREGKDPQIVINRARPMTDFSENVQLDEPVQPEKPKVLEGTLWLKLESQNDPRYGKVRAIVNMFPGNSEVRVFFADIRKMSGAKASLDSRMLEELKNLLGNENVVVK